MFTIHSIGWVSGSGLRWGGLRLSRLEFVLTNGIDCARIDTGGVGGKGGDRLARFDKSIALSGCINGYRLTAGRLITSVGLICKYGNGSVAISLA